MQVRNNRQRNKNSPPTLNTVAPGTCSALLSDNVMRNGIKKTPKRAFFIYRRRHGRAHKNQHHASWPEIFLHDGPAIH